MKTTWIFLDAIGRYTKDLWSLGYIYLISSPLNPTQGSGRCDVSIVTKGYVHRRRATALSHCLFHLEAVGQGNGLVRLYEDDGSNIRVTFARVMH